MSKYRVSPMAICPCYLHEDAQVIYCNGVQDNSVIHLAFATKTDSRSYKQEHCQKDYCSCYIYKMLKRITEDTNGRKIH